MTPAARSKAKRKPAPNLANPIEAVLASLFDDPHDVARRAQDDKSVSHETLMARAELLRSWSEHPWNWLTGKDTDGSPIIRTKDEGADDPIKPWPTDLEYLRWYIELLYQGKEHPQLFVDKARQLMFTWATLLYVDWECRFRVARRWLLSKSTEEEAKELLADKPAFVNRHLPLWVQDSLPVKDTPKSRMIYMRTGSYILAVAENVADREARGGTASGVIVDECARQFAFGDIVVASLPMASRIIAITTAELGNAGAAYSLDLKKSAEKHGVVLDEQSGDFESRHGPYWLLRKDPVTKWTVLEIDAEAHPKYRSAAAHEELERKLGKRKYQQEIRRDWTISSGDPFYPEVAANPDLYILPPGPFPLLPGPIIRGWDFGYRYPFVCWLQINDRRNRVVVLREWMPHNIDAGSFAELVLWLSGELEEHQLGMAAYMRAQEIKRDPNFPPIPFFQSTPSAPLQFVDYSGPEALVERSEVTSEAQERSVAQILAKKGIQLGWWGVSLAQREIIVRKLLRMQKDGWPGILFSPECRILVQAFRGGLTFKRPQRGERVGVVRNKDGFFDNADDGLGYALANLIPVEGELPQPGPAVQTERQTTGRDTFSRVPIGDDTTPGMSIGYRG